MNLPQAPTYLSHSLNLEQTLSSLMSQGGLYLHSLRLALQTICSSNLQLLLQVATSFQPFLFLLEALVFCQEHQWQHLSWQAFPPYYLRRKGTMPALALAQEPYLRLLLRGWPLHTPMVIRYRVRLYKVLV